MKRVWNIILLILAIFPIIGLFEGKVSSILIFSIFVLVYLWKGLQKFFNKIPLPLWFLYIFWGTIFGALTQTFVQIEGFEKSFSADPVYHFIQALTIYIFLTIIWFVLQKKYAFTLKHIFLITGLWGVVIEGLLIYGSVDLYAWLFLFTVYGSYPSIVYLLTKNRFEVIEGRKKPTFWVGLTAFITLSLALVFAQISISILAVFGIR